MHWCCSKVSQSDNHSVLCWSISSGHFKCSNVFVTAVSDTLSSLINILRILKESVLYYSGLAVGVCLCELRPGCWSARPQCAAAGRIDWGEQNKPKHLQTHSTYSTLATTHMWNTMLDSCLKAVFIVSRAYLPVLNLVLISSCLRYVTIEILWIIECIEALHKLTWPEMIQATLYYSLRVLLSTSSVRLSVCAYISPQRRPALIWVCIHEAS